MRASAVSWSGAGKPLAGGSGPEFMTTSGNLTLRMPEKKSDIFVLPHERGVVFIYTGSMLLLVKGTTSGTTHTDLHNHVKLCTL